MKVITVVIMSLFFLNCFAQNNEKSKAEVNALLDNWHKAAAEANFDAYFSAMDSESIFIGTDATENWNKTDFIAFAKPYFDKGKAWNFTALERNIYFDKSDKTAWFDELLDTQMKICRGSGVLVKVGKEWKIKHYVLSMTIPNENVNEVIKIKEIIENPIIDKLKK
jgi:hypothetical protein